MYVNTTTATVIIIIIDVQLRKLVKIKPFWGKINIKTKHNYRITLI